MQSFGGGGEIEMCGSGIDRVLQFVDGVAAWQEQA
jgi:hypothetical protein